MILSIVFLLLGLGLLIVGGDTLVRGAIGLAERLHIPPIIIGLTVVALGTSAPELVVSVQAALADAGGLAIGNVVGSNIANVLLVLGLPSLLKPTDCREKGIGKNLAIMLGLTVVFMGMLGNGRLGRTDGLILLALLGLFLWDQYMTARKARRRKKAQADYHDEIENIPSSNLVIGGLLLAGIICLPLGAHLTVLGATQIAETLGVSDEAIGLTVVAIGTSLPELATSLLAVIRKNASVALGNVVGSNILNICAIMGVTAALVPLPVANRVIIEDMWVMLAAAILITAFAHYRVTIGKRIGLAMLGAYTIFIASAFVY